MSDPPSASSSEACPESVPVPASPAFESCPSEPAGRRGWLKRAAAVALGGLGLLVPAGLGTLFALDPVLRRGSRDGDGALGAFRRVAPLDAVPVGAPPRSFPVIADREDAWSRTPNAEIGSVLLFRENDETVLAWSTVCPHFGCRIDWRGDRDAFFCPCHDSLFAPDGERKNDKSPRDMDRLDTEIRNGQIWVAYQEFKTGTAEQIPV